MEGFAERHGPLDVADIDPDTVRFRAADGATADCAVPFPPFHWPPTEAAAEASEPVAAHGSPDAPARTPAAVAAALGRHARTDRRVGVVLARLGGYAAGIFDGATLVASKVGARPVHGRSAAGGQSQRRFARRREHQARRALAAAADTVVRVVAPHVPGAIPPGQRAPGPPLEAVVCGGDRAAIDMLRRDRRLSRVFALETGPFLTVPDPRLSVLKGTPRLFRAVGVRVVEPDDGR